MTIVSIEYKYRYRYRYNYENKHIYTKTNKLMNSIQSKLPKCPNDYFEFLRLIHIVKVFFKLNRLLTMKLIVFAYIYIFSSYLYSGEIENCKFKPRNEVRSYLVEEACNSALKYMGLKDSYVRNYRWNVQDEPSTTQDYCLYNNRTEFLSDPLGRIKYAKIAIPENVFASHDNKDVISLCDARFSDVDENLICKYTTLYKESITPPDPPVNGPHVSGGIIGYETPSVDKVKDIVKNNSSDELDKLKKGLILKLYLSEEGKFLTDEKAIALDICKKKFSTDSKGIKKCVKEGSFDVDTYGRRYVSFISPVSSMIDTDIEIIKEKCRNATNDSPSFNSCVRGIDCDKTGNRCVFKSFRYRADSDDNKHAKRDLEEECIDKTLPHDSRVPPSTSVNNSTPPPRRSVSLYERCKNAPRKLQSSCYADILGERPKELIRACSISDAVDLKDNDTSNLEPDTSKTIKQ